MRIIIFSDNDKRGETMANCEIKYLNKLYIEWLKITLVDSKLTSKSIWILRKNISFIIKQIA